ncbi:MAG: CBS domain-containing protein [SAR202 cluster bacterium]|nr:CBS domain-containing protein [SAR202 cluster bacterium]
MGGTIVIGRIFGIDIKIHFSWVLIFILVAWSLANTEFKTDYPDWGVNVRWGLGILGSILLFSSVLFHELSHSILAMVRGHKVRGITLFILGGVSEIEEEAHKPGEEFWIAFVGPLSSFFLGGVFYLLAWQTEGVNDYVHALSAYLSFINLALGVFNLIPGYPMDGGRVLKAAVWRATGSVSRATRVASRSGMVVAFLMMAGGLGLAFIWDSWSGLWLVLIGWFLMSAASSTRRQEAVRAHLSGRRVRDAMRSGYPSAPPGISVQRLVDEYMARGFERTYLVVLGDTVHGLVSAADVALVPPEERHSKYVTEIMVRPPNIAFVSPDDPLEAAMQKMSAGEFHQLPVLENGKPVGMVSRGDVMRVLELSSLVGPRK